MLPDIYTYLVQESTRKSHPVYIDRAWTVSTWIKELGRLLI